VRRYLGWLAVLTAATAALPLTAQLVALPSGPAGLLLVAGLVLVGGLPLAVVGTQEFSLMGDLAAATRRTRAFAVMGSVIALGTAAGAAVTGVVVEGFGAPAALWVPAACMVLALLVVAAGRRVLHRDLILGSDTPERIAP
jgi:predicted MFS family arabinose efflux permease